MHLAENTGQRYDRLFSSFTDFAIARGACSLPASVELVEAFVAAELAKGIQPRTVRNSLFAISSMHEWQGHPDPTAALRPQTRARLGANPIPYLLHSQWARIEQILEQVACPVARDRDALILSLAAHAYTPTGMSRLRVADLRDDGLSIDGRVLRPGDRTPCPVIRARSMRARLMRLAERPDQSLVPSIRCHRPMRQPMPIGSIASRLSHYAAACSRW